MVALNQRGSLRWEQPRARKRQEETIDGCKGDGFWGTQSLKGPQQTREDHKNMRWCLLMVAFKIIFQC